LRWPQSTAVPEPPETNDRLRVAAAQDGSQLTFNATLEFNVLLVDGTIEDYPPGRLGETQSRARAATTAWTGPAR
jgi:hypothetical protein